MGLNLTALNPQQLAASAVAGLIITAGQGGNAANIIKRANGALQFATALGQLAQGNPQPAFTTLQASLLDSNIDPGVQVALQGLLTFGVAQAQILTGVAGAAPVFGDVAEAVAANVSAGITAAANAEIAKYSGQVAAPAAAAK